MQRAVRNDATWHDGAMTLRQPTTWTRQLLATVTLTLAACSTDATNGHDDASSAAPDAAGDSAANDGADAGAPGERNVIEDWESQGVWLWQQRGPVPPVHGTAELTPARAASSHAYHFADLSSSAGAELAGHSHRALPSDATIVFWARTGLPNPERLIVAVTGAVTEDYVSATASRARTWRGKEVIVLPTWTEVRIPLADLAPLGPGTPEPLHDGMTVMLHFITLAETFDFWIDDVAIECAQSCP